MRKLLFLTLLITMSSFAFAQKYNDLSKSIINRLDGTILTATDRILEDGSVAHEYTVALDSYMNMELMKSIVKSMENKTIISTVPWTISEDKQMIFKNFKIKENKKLKLGSLAIGYVIDQNCILISAIDY